MEIKNSNNQINLNNNNNNNNNKNNNNNNSNSNINNNSINRAQLNNKDNNLQNKGMISNKNTKSMNILIINKSSTLTKKTIQKNDISQNKLEQINESNELNNEINNLKNEIKKLKDELKDLKEKNNSLSKENNNLKKTVEKKDSEIKKLKSKNKNLEKEKKELNNTLIKIKKINPFALHESPTLIGLENIGAKCFINATLQCLSQTKNLTKYFLNKKYEDRIINNNVALNNKNDSQLAPAYLELIQKLWEINGNKKYSPNKFNNTLYNISSIFKNTKNVGPKDLVVFVLEQLHKELKKAVNNGNSNNSQNLNQYNQKSAFDYFFNDFTNNTSIISDIFFGVNETKSICLNCKTAFSQKGLNIPICYDFGNFYFLSFPLEEIRNMKMNNCMNNQTVQNPNFNVLNLNDCFFYNQKSEYFTGENKNFCNICKLYYDSIFNSKIYVSPNILILILDRGIENINDIKVYFTETIDITQFVIFKESSPLIYKLYGVVSQVNQDGSSQHFIASCKSPINNKWYKYDDTNVTPISNVQSEVICFGNPYILFYQKIN